VARLNQGNFFVPQVVLDMNFRWLRSSVLHVFLFAIERTVSASQAVIRPLSLFH